MTKRIFSIEWDDELGPMWMNRDNLLICLNNYCHDIDFIIEDITIQNADLLKVLKTAHEIILKANKTSLGYVPGVGKPRRDQLLERIEQALAQAKG